MDKTTRTPQLLLCITGSISAYKTPDIVRRLQANNIRVKVILSRGGLRFITKLALQSVCHDAVYTDEDAVDGQNKITHTTLAKWADLILVAPASANCVAKIAHGYADNLISETVLASKAPLCIAPAMNQAMWRNETTQENIHLCAQAHHHILLPASGEQACGDVGPGRLPDTENIVSHVCNRLEDIRTQPYAGVRLLITAGATQEPLDPMRYISNRSSGKMGYALAAAAQHMGAHVSLISGPTHLTPPVADCHFVQTAMDMDTAVQAALTDYDAFISCAAVADYRPAHYNPDKIKKDPNQDDCTIHLVKNPDILARAKAHHPHVYCVGFAAETNNLYAHAKQKLTHKGCDAIIANEIQSTVNQDTATATLITRKTETHFDSQHKSDLARALLITLHTDFKAFSANKRHASEDTCVSQA